MYELKGRRGKKEKIKDKYYFNVCLNCHYAIGFSTDPAEGYCPKCGGWMNSIRKDTLLRYLQYAKHIYGIDVRLLHKYYNYWRNIFECDI